MMMTILMLAWSFMAVSSTLNFDFPFLGIMANKASPSTFMEE